MLEFSSFRDKKELTASNELFVEIAMIAFVIAMIGLVIAGIRESIKEAKRMEEYKKKIQKILEFVRKYYPAICNAVNKQKKKDPFYFKDKSNLYDVNEVVQSLGRGIEFLRQASKYRPSWHVMNVINNPNSTENDIKIAVNEDLMDSLPHRFNTPEERSMTKVKAGWLNASAVLNMLNQFDQFTDYYFWFFDHLHAKLQLNDKYLENRVDRYLIHNCLSNTGIFELFRSYDAILLTLKDILIHAKKLQEDE